MGYKILLLVIIVCSNAGCSSGGLSRDDKIYGGTVVSGIREMPWMVSVQASGTNQSTGIICGGTLVTKVYVITACHCLFRPPTVVDGTVRLELIDTDFNLWYFIAGSTAMIEIYKLDPSKTPTDSTDTQFRKPAALLHHPECGNEACPGCYCKDMGLGKMTVPFKITAFVKPLEITLDLKTFDNSLKKLFERLQSGQRPQCTISGWGLSTKVPTVIPENWTYPPLAPGTVNMLKSMTIVNFTLHLDTCMKWIKDAYQVEGSEPTEYDINEEKYVLPGDICTLGEDNSGHSQGRQGWSSSCSGDSGGGMICSDTGPKVELLGLLSFGYGCGTGMPKAFQTLGSGLEWLKMEMCKEADYQEVTELHPQCHIPSQGTVQAFRSAGPKLASLTTRTPPSSTLKNRLCMWSMMPVLLSLEM